VKEQNLEFGTIGLDTLWFFGFFFHYPFSSAYDIDDETRQDKIMRLFLPPKKKKKRNSTLDWGELDTS
jgi:hypothetical protein